MFRLNKIIPADSDYKFLIYRKNFYIISSIAIILSLVLLLFKGLNLGIDFKGGTLIEVSTKNTNISELRDVLSPNFNEVSLQEFGDEKTIIIRLQNENNQESIETVNKVKQLINNKVEEFRRSEFVGPTISSELLWKGFQAVTFALFAILIYIWLRFEWQFGFGAVVALTHDVLFTLGLLSLLNIEFSLSTIAAVLTIAGYSINDTVVIFDRVRENLRKYKKLELLDLFNMSINNTLSRTVMTSITTLLALLSLYIFGGEVIKPFALTMIIGVLIGTYSSIFIAVPTLLVFKFRPQDEEEN
jgi:preprotein translocase subunit SecF